MTVLSNHKATHGPFPYLDEGLSELLENINTDAGWDFRNYKKSSLKRRISVRLGTHNISTFKDYYSFLQSNPEEYNNLVSTIAIKVSEFFREPDVFCLLSKLIAQSFSANEGLKLWSCACAHGEEAYSLGIILADSIGAENLQNVKIFATDIDGTALNKARKAVYGEEAMQNVGSAIRARYFIRMGERYKVKYSIRNLVRFGALDIVKNNHISRVDVLLCRNLLIYFEKGLQKRVLEKLDLALKPGGVLVLGKAELLPPPFSSRYREIVEKSRVYRKMT